jgi:hypothetical protein
MLLTADESTPPLEYRVDPKDEVVRVEKKAVLPL